MKNLLLLIVLIFSINLHCLVHLQEHADSLILTTVFGTVTINEPVLIELIKSCPFERLKHIRQYGVVCHMRPEPEYTRYQHSLGVFFLTRKYGAPLQEQIAALLHDVSHTVFSHVGDNFFKSNYHRGGKNSYQDEIHEWYLEKAGLMSILHKYGYQDACAGQVKKHQRCFEQKLPDLCADRIEYNLTGGLIDDLLSKNDVKNLLKSLHFEKGQWFFDTVDAARKFALVTLQLTEQRWGSMWSAFIDYSAAQALARACELGVITLDDIHFSTDDIVWEKLVACADSCLTEQIHKVEHCNDYCRACNSEQAELHLHGKFSGTDPLVLYGSELIRLSELDENYKKEYERVKNLVVPGYDIKLIN